MIRNSGPTLPITHGRSEVSLLAVVSNPDEIHKLTSRIKSRPNIDIDKARFIALNTSTYQGLTKKGLDCKMPADYGLSDAEADEEALKWFRAFPNAKLKNGKNIKELLEHKGLSIWWLVDETIYWSTFVFRNSSLREALKQAIIFDHILKAENPSMVWCTRGSKTVYQVTNAIARSRSITMLASPPYFDIKGYLSQRLSTIIFTYGQLTMTFVRKVWWTLLGGNSYPAPVQNGKRILIFSGDNWWNIYNLKTGAIQKGQKTFDSVIDILNENGHTVVLVDTHVAATNIDIRVMRQKKLQNRMAYRPFASYLNFRVILGAFRAARRVRKDYQSLCDSTAFTETMNWHDVPLWNLAQKNFSFAFSLSNLTRIITTCEMAKRMVEMEEPDGILMSGEFSSERPMVATARPKGIPTLFFQHGIYSPYHPHYNHSDGDISPNGECSASYCPIPDKLAAYSDHDKINFISRGKFSENDVLVIGQPRYDIVARAPQIFNRQETFKKLNLDPNKKLIVWTTITHGLSRRENERNIAAVYNAMKSLAEVQLIIKLHPSENQKAPLYKKNKSCNPVILGREANTFELLYTSDIVLADPHCTTALEAIILGKPMISINLRGTSDPYAEEGAALDVYNAAQLIPAIKDMLYNKEIRQRLAEGRKKFAYDHAYLIDGQASKRVADLIIQMVEEAKKNKVESK